MKGDIYSRLAKASKKPDVRGKAIAQQRHFEKHKDNPITQEVYDSLPDHTKMLYSTD
jgi:hypothetical protein